MRLLALGLVLAFVAPAVAQTSTPSRTATRTPTSTPTQTNTARPTPTGATPTPQSFNVFTMDGLLVNGSLAVLAVQAGNTIQLGSSVFTLPIAAHIRPEFSVACSRPIVGRSLRFQRYVGGVATATDDCTVATGGDHCDNLGSEVVNLSAKALFNVRSDVSVNSGSDSNTVCSVMGQFLRMDDTPYPAALMGGVNLTGAMGVGPAFCGASSPTDAPARCSATTALSAAMPVPRHGRLVGLGVVSANQGFGTRTYTVYNATTGRLSDLSLTGCGSPFTCPQTSTTCTHDCEVEGLDKLALFLQCPTGTCGNLNAVTWTILVEGPGGLVPVSNQLRVAGYGKWGGQWNSVSQAGTSFRVPLAMSMQSLVLSLEANPTEINGEVCFGASASPACSGPRPALTLGVDVLEGLDESEFGLGVGGYFGFNKSFTGAAGANTGSVHGVLEVGPALPTDTPTPTPIDTSTPTASPTETPTPTFTPTPTETFTDTPTPTPTRTNTSQPTCVPNLGICATDGQCCSNSCVGLVCIGNTRTPTPTSTPTRTPTLTPTLNCVVNSVLDSACVDDPPTSCTTDIGECTLRCAFSMLHARLCNQGSKVRCNIPGDDPLIIALQSSLPNLAGSGTDPDVDCSTQPGTTCGGIAGSGGRNLRVTVDGTLAVNGIGLGDNSILRGFRFTHFPLTANGIIGEITGVNVTVQCNTFDDNPASGIIQGNDPPSNDIFIGGSNPGDGNEYINGSQVSGRCIAFAGASVWGNSCGMTWDGALARNQGRGIDAGGYIPAGGSSFGGPGDAKRNIVVANADVGMSISADAMILTVANNIIGRNLAGAEDPPYCNANPQIDDNSLSGVTYSSNAVGTCLPTFTATPTPVNTPTPTESPVPGCVQLAGPLPTTTPGHELTPGPCEVISEGLGLVKCLQFTTDGGSPPTQEFCDFVNFLSGATPAATPTGTPAPPNTPAPICCRYADVTVQGCTPDGDPNGFCGITPTPEVIAPGTCCLCPTPVTCSGDPGQLCDHTCDLVAGAACEGGTTCVTFTPAATATATPLPTETPVPTLTPVKTPSPYVATFAGQALEMDIFHGEVEASQQGRCALYFERESGVNSLYFKCFGLTPHKVEVE